MINYSHKVFFVFNLVTELNSCTVAVHKCNIKYIKSYTEDAKYKQVPGGE